MAVIATFYDHIKEIARQEDRTVLDAMKLARECGVELLEVSANSVIGREDELGQELAAAEMGISAIPGYFDFGRDTDVHKQCSPLLEAASFLGADKILVIPGFHEPEDSPETREAHIQNMERCINELAEEAEKTGVTLVMEDYDSELSPFSTKEGLRRFLDNCPKLGCAFDTGNFQYMAQDSLSAYELLRGRITHVHLKDRIFQPDFGGKVKTAVDGTPLYPAPVGYGKMHIPEILELLKRDGYDGIYTMEFYDAENTREILEKSAAWLKAHL